MSALPRPVRKDVLRNRARLLKAADEVIAEHGLDLSLNAVAHHAGVGVGTVYRHFPDRDAILDALLEQRVERVVEIMRSHLGDEDPVAALRAAVLAICEMQSSDRGLWELLAAGKSDAHRATMRDRLVPLADELIDRARRTGRMRPELQGTDLALMLWIGGALRAYGGDISPEIWRRYVNVLLDGFEAAEGLAREPLPVPALTAAEVDRVMRQWRPGATRAN